MYLFTTTYLGIFSLIISIFSFFNIIYSYYFNLYLNLNSYVYSLIISLILGSIFLFKKDDSVVFLAKKDSISYVENIFRLSSI